MRVNRAETNGTYSKFFTGEKMKNKKWLTYTLGILLTLVVLAAVGGAGFRIGMMQNASFTRAVDGMGLSPFAHNFNSERHQTMQGNPHHNDGSFPGMQGNPHNQGFDNRGSDRRGGMSFFSPIFGLIRLVVLGLLLWVGYKFVKKSGWRLTRVAASPAPATSETVSVEEKKEEV
jgi:hypothetical protein